jgi:hypothetical protein
MAERHRRIILGLTATERPEYVQRLVAESEIAFGVWPDPRGTGGFGFRLIKGREHLAALLADDLPNPMTTTAIPCVGQTQAITAEEFWEGTAPSPNPPKALLQAKPRIVRTR